MGNNRNCDVCADASRSQMDMRRQKAGMYDSRYARSQMMPGTQMGCEIAGNNRSAGGCETCGNARTGNTGVCGNTRVGNGCEVCGNTKVGTSCEVCESTRMGNNVEACGSARAGNKYETCGMVRVENSCNGCGNSMRDELRGMPLAMGYVPWQNFGCTYEPMEGLRSGTIFPELDKPFYGRRGMR